MSRNSRSTICAASRSVPSDYLKIAEAFHTIMLAGIPVLPAAERNGRGG